jgi:hypothetical protein
VCVQTKKKIKIKFQEKIRFQTPNMSTPQPLTFVSFEDLEKAGVTDYQELLKQPGGRRKLFTALLDVVPVQAQSLLDRLDASEEKYRRYMEEKAKEQEDEVAPEAAAPAEEPKNDEAVPEEQEITEAVPEEAR